MVPSEICGKCHLSWRLVLDFGGGHLEKFFDPSNVGSKSLGQKIQQDKELSSDSGVGRSGFCSSMAMDALT